MNGHFAIVLLLLSVSSLPQGGSRRLHSATRLEGTTWPLPQQMERGVKIPFDASNFQFRTQFYCDVLDNAIEYYRTILTAFWKSNAVNDPLLEETGGLNALNIVVGQPCPLENPNWDMQECYNLTITADGKATLTAPEVWGVLRGLETFSQLIVPAFNDGDSMHIWTVQIADWPRFQYRGILLDTSRHFIPVSLIKSNLELMAQNKFNVFHWHIVDDPAFPLESKVYPELTARGAYSRHHVYSQDDVQDVVRYARLWGIRVVVEIDTPAHVMSWGNGMPNFLSNCSGTKQLTYPRPTGTLNPTVSDNFDFLAGLFKEVLTLFTDRHVHLGGDEVDYPCWAADKSVRKFMTEMNYTDISEVNNYYFNHIFKIIHRVDPSRRFIFWEEVYNKHTILPADAVVQVWLSNYAEKLAQITKDRTYALLSSCWYLSNIAFGNDWEKYYNCDPHGFNGTAEQKRFVLGGTACMWGEWVDGTNLIPRLWPRASVVAERLWSNAAVNSTKAATPRLEEHRCRMLSRNYQVQPITGPGFCQDVPAF